MPGLLGLNWTCEWVKSWPLLSDCRFRVWIQSVNRSDFTTSTEWLHVSNWHSVEPHHNLELCALGMYGRPVGSESNLWIGQTLPLVTTECLQVSNWHTVEPHHNLELCALEMYGRPVGSESNLWISQTWPLLSDCMFWTGIQWNLIIWMLVIQKPRHQDNKLTW